jgi:hypothetical protein
MVGLVDGVDVMGVNAMFEKDPNARASSPTKVSADNEQKLP